jgi:hypothetical protein
MSMVGLSMVGLSLDSCSKSQLKDHIAVELTTARARSLALTDVLGDDELCSQYSSLMSPLVWDLAHVGNMEELWALRAVAGQAPLRPEIDPLYDAFEHPRTQRPTLPLLRPAESRQYIATVRDRSLDVRRELPMWADANLASIARVICSGAVLAAVRSATEGMAHGEGAVAPFAAGQWLFSHNGRIDGWPDSAAPLAAELPATGLMTLDAASDSALLWALTRSRLVKDPSLAEVPAAIVELAAPTGADRLKPPAHGRRRRGRDGVGRLVVLPRKRRQRARPARRRRRVGAL